MQGRIVLFHFYICYNRNQKSNIGRIKNQPNRSVCLKFLLNLNLIVLSTITTPNMNVAVEIRIVGMPKNLNTFHAVFFINFTLKMHLRLLLSFSNAAYLQTCPPALFSPV